MTRAAKLGPFVFLALLIAIPFWQLATLRGVPLSDDSFTGDLLNGSFAYRVELRSALRSGEFPLWAPGL